MHRVSKHLKKIDGREPRVLKLMVDVKVGVVEHTVLVEGICLGVRNMSSRYS